MKIPHRYVSLITISRGKREPIPHRYVSLITISRGKGEPKNININKSSTIEI